ncbi:MAG: hypothetical protein IIB81_03420 [Nanoarchaeota archaeon]|nr:hypothetical protein [Nanoarchaeota archaeon]
MVDFADVKEVDSRNTALYKRMDADRDLLYLKKYVMKDVDNQTVSGIVNVTLNLPATFAAHVNASLLGAQQQVKVSGDDITDDKARVIEDFITAVIASADARLRRRGEATLRPFAAEQMDIRGRGAFRCTVRMQNGKVIIDILPVDTRFFTSEIGEDGLIWGAFKTWRSPALVKSKYPNYSRSWIWAGRRRIFTV